jgi:aerobic carbon-monoxide dehydrogenase small subunit
MAPGHGGGSLTVERTQIHLTVNGRDHDLWVWPNQSLLSVLRQEVGATEVKYGCGEGVCSTCAVLLEGESINSCLLFAVQADGGTVTTIKGFAEDDGDMHPLQEAFLRHAASQCGFCTPGMLTVAYEFLQRNPRPTRDEIRAVLAGNLCRCTGYTKIVDAVYDHAVAISG